MSPILDSHVQQGSASQPAQQLGQIEKTAAPQPQPKPQQQGSQPIFRDWAAI